jgi:hypothetical protein
MTSSRTHRTARPGAVAGLALAVLACGLSGCDEHSTTGPDAPTVTGTAPPTGSAPRTTLDLTPPGQSPKATVSASVRPGSG